MNFFFTLGDLMTEVKNFFFAPAVCSEWPIYPNSSNAFMSSWLQKMLRIPKRKKTKNAKNITTLVCFALSSWGVRNWQKGKTGERLVTGKKIPCVVKKTLLQPQHFLSTCKAQAVKIEWMHETIPNIAKKKKKNRLSLKSNRNWSNMFVTQISQHDYIQKWIQTQLTKREFVIMLISLILHDLICCTDAAVFLFEG